MAERSRSNNRADPYPPRGTVRMGRVPYSTTISSSRTRESSNNTSSASSSEWELFQIEDSIVSTDDDDSDDSSDDDNEPVQSKNLHNVSASAFSLSNGFRTPQRPRAPEEVKHTTLTPQTNRIHISSQSETETSSTLEYKVIAHDKDVQKEMDRHQLPWGVQYEIARGVSDRRWKWADVTWDKIRMLRSDSNVTASRVPAVMLGKTPVATLVDEQKMWKELDREQMALEEHENRGLGLHGLDEAENESWDGVKRWYGGRIQQTILVELVDEKPQLRLAPMEMRKSNRFARFLGSRRMLSLNLPKRWQGGEKFMRNKFVLCGRVFVPFCVKDNGAYLFEINDDYQRNPNENADGYRISLQDLINWHNPLELNSKQAVSKWVARFDLGLSTSIPALKFKPENIFRESDVEIHGKVFTDGCGFMNLAGLVQIARNLGFERIPCAVQGRILGSKGLWTIHPYDRNASDEPKIWIRDSQVKVKLAPNWSATEIAKLHPAHLIFDLVQPSRVSAPSRLSKYPILNLSHNRVPTDLIMRLMEDTLREIIQPFTQWDCYRAMMVLWCTIYRSGNITTRRLQRHAAGLARALGISRQFREYGPNGELITEDSENEDGDENGEEKDSEQETDTNPDARLFAAPDSLHESVLELIQAGFNPSSSFILHQKIATIVRQILKDYLNDYHIVVTESAEALIIPDPYGVLEEGQIHFRASQPLVDAQTNLDPYQLMGKVLLFRNPCRLPSDIQPAEAVSHPSLAEYKDVIILPVKGSHPLADRLAGGDTAVCIFNQEIVKAFVPPSFNAVPNDFIESNFESQSQTLQVSQFAEEIRRANGRELEIIQDKLLAGFINNRIGIYSGFHDNAVWAYGLGSEKTVRLAHMFNHVLDSRKSGLIVKKEIFGKDSRQFQRALPECMSSGKGSRRNNDPYLPRDPRLGPFILKQLQDRVEVIRQDVMANKLKTENFPKDPNLLRPWTDAMKVTYDAVKQELKLIQAHVDSCREDWPKVWHSEQGSNHDSSDKNVQKKEKQNHQRRLQNLREKFRQVPDGIVMLPLLGPGIVDILKASYAYTLRDSEPFAFSMAFKLLCRIKAESQGMVAVTREFSESMSIPGSIARILTLEQQTEG
ncbi:hypothetical protein QCA50_002400 [Cerrena zonata]|uniref:RNA-dependent RNA polymerase n=1 Tax=Cerrena zonata TaxID=2478898 RepID=A0AAW0GVA6_9APHY